MKKGMLPFYPEGPNFSIEKRCSSDSIFTETSYMKNANIEFATIGSLVVRDQSGIVGTTGSSGPTGFPGVTGETGPDGLIGLTGFQGPTGLEGNATSIGTTGTTGPTGPTGHTGDKGFQGPSGLEGITSSTGVTGNIGITGPTGPTGLEGFLGEAGLTGLTGNTGNTGPTGDKGFQGPSGFKGITTSIGATGDDGPTGPTGHTGIEGFLGEPGLTGNKGLTGFTGHTGDKGFQGPTGLEGITTSIGATGDVGHTGPTGHTGIEGFVGENGLTGNKGPTGFTGPTGDKGFQGPSGLEGNTSSTGATGATGPTGSTGPSGYIGPTGIEGLQGIQGITSVDGTTGYTGPTGFTGPTGITGFRETSYRMINKTESQTSVPAIIYTFPSESTDFIISINDGEQIIEDVKGIDSDAVETYYPSDCKMLLSYLSQKNFVFEYDFYGTLTISMQWGGTVGAGNAGFIEGYFGIIVNDGGIIPGNGKFKWGGNSGFSYKTFPLFASDTPTVKNLLGPVNIGFHRNMRADIDNNNNLIKNTINAYFRYTITLTTLNTDDLSNKISFRYAVNFSFFTTTGTPQQEYNRFVTGTQTLDFNNVNDTTISAILLPAFVPSNLSIVKNDRQSVSITKFGHTFRQIA